ncbi:hypothetical protein ADK38_43780, partial [Streptomyces varsoviensis]
MAAMTVLATAGMATAGAGTVADAGAPDGPAAAVRERAATAHDRDGLPRPPGPAGPAAGARPAHRGSPVTVSEGGSSVRVSRGDAWGGSSGGSSSVSVSGGGRSSASVSG